jgi:hypothetical protein
VPSANKSADFSDIWPIADTIPGWLTMAQAGLLHEQARALHRGELAVEIGSHQGRSTVVLAHALRSRGSRLVAVDPFVDGRLFGGSPTKSKFETNVRAAGVQADVELREAYSTKLRPLWQEQLGMLYIDGKHDYWTVSDDLRWTRHVRPEGVVLIHDAFSSIGVTLGLLHHVLLGSTLAYELREGSLALFRRRPPALRDRLRLLAQLPWWISNVVIKVLLRLRLRPVARLLGHDSPYDPY